MDCQRSESNLRQIAMTIHAYRSAAITFLSIGELLTSVQTHQAPNTCAVVSPCGRFVACAGMHMFKMEFFVQIDNLFSKQGLPLMSKYGRWSLRVTTLIRYVKDLVIFTCYATRAFFILVGS